MKIHYRIYEENEKMVMGKKTDLHQALIPHFQ